MIPLPQLLDGDPPPRMTKTEAALELLKLAGRPGGVSTVEALDELGIEARRWRRLVAALEAAGLVVRHPPVRKASHPSEWVPAAIALKPDAFGVEEDAP